MSKKQPPRRSGAASDDLSHVLSVGGLLGAIAIVLVVGALLRVDRPAAPGPVPTDPRPPIRVDPLPAATAPAPQAPSRTDLATRVVEDLERIGSVGWSRQLAAVCDPDNVQRWLVAHGARDELFVLPVTIDERPCFRICWGRWESERAAARARVPGAVVARAGGDGRVRAVPELLP